MRITPKPQLITLLTCGSVDLFPVVVIVVVVSLVINKLQLLPHTFDTNLLWLWPRYLPCWRKVYLYTTVFLVKRPPAHCMLDPMAPLPITRSAVQSTYCPEVTSPMFQLSHYPCLFLDSLIFPSFRNLLIDSQVYVQIYMYSLRQQAPKSVRWLVQFIPRHPHIPRGLWTAQRCCSRVDGPQTPPDSEALRDATSGRWKKQEVKVSQRQREGKEQTDRQTDRQICKLTFFHKLRPLMQ